MNKADIVTIEKAIGYTFKNKSLLIQAFTRRSYCNEKRQAGDTECECNEVLEFLGDSVLGCSVIYEMTGKYSSVDERGMHSMLDEGALTVIKSNLSDKRMLSSRIDELGLYKYFLLGEGDKRESISRQPSVMEDLFESIIGAIFIDSGRDFEVARNAVVRMLDTEQFLKKNYKKNPKNIIQEYAQARKLPFSYLDKGCKGPDHDRTYYRALLLDGKEYKTAKANSIKNAELAAAALAAEELGI